MAKPEVEIYLYAAAQLGAAPDQLVFVGDGSDDELAGAAAAGLTPVLVEVDSTNTYDPERGTVRAWTGARVKALPELLELLGWQGLLLGRTKCCCVRHAHEPARPDDRRRPAAH